METPSTIFSSTCVTELPLRASQQLDLDHKHHLDELAAQQLQVELDAHVASLESKPTSATEPQQSNAPKSNSKSKPPSKKTAFDYQADFIPFDDISDGPEEVKLHLERKPLGGPPKRLRYGDHPMK